MREYLLLIAYTMPCLSLDGQAAPCSNFQFHNSFIYLFHVSNCLMPYLTSSLSRSLRLPRQSPSRPASSHITFYWGPPGGDVK
ncbi:hypothetical protein BDP55DRAFT_644687 [Colletotrichum godetiae]|uniref:Secreted protein n=1 Tax=Colletotrichum godetiae TaxID=1209918 RepID=A0AAJ0AYC5_9PEZI|nr:uncharacterized protein BDP55DRAFT_644687 [Colletotrichum godetiae]KAK1699740.1 hypothetical protein BDP55DRAFT_644687 [Colletotrichum godetiae]